MSVILDRCVCGQLKSSTTAVCAACQARQADEKPAISREDRLIMLVLACMGIVAVFCLAGLGRDERAEKVPPGILDQDYIAQRMNARQEWSQRMLAEQRGERWTK